LSVWQRIKGWFRRKPAEVVPFREPEPELEQVLSNYATSAAVERGVWIDEDQEWRPVNHVLAIAAENSPNSQNNTELRTQFAPPTCSCCRCQPSIYRTYGDGTVLCVECAG
jgi:hypothetical protein